MAKLTEKQQRFADEYLIDLNGTQAAIRAGYSPKTAAEQGSRMLRVVKVRAHIDKQLAERSKRTGINQDRVLQELARIAFVRATDVIDLETASILPDASDDDLAVIQSVKVKNMHSDNVSGTEREIKFTDKLKALDMLGKHLGMFNDKVTLDGQIGIVQIVDDIPSDGDG